MRAALAYALIDLCIRADPRAQRLLNKTESPLERLWLSIWYPGAPPDTTVEPQKQIGPYRVDFLVDSRLIVEIDGYLYHRASRQQVINDYKRDRYLTAQGYAVMRFSGYEVWDDAWACVAEVKAFLADDHVPANRERASPTQPEPGS